VYKNIYNFTPFEHENVDFKNNIINAARNQDQTKVEGALAAVLIYVNLVDYLARHLLENLLKMISIQGFRAFGGVMFFDGSRQRTNISLGGICAELQSFEFPSKTDFLDSLKEFNKLRNHVMHNLMQLDPNDRTGQIDKDVVRIKQLAEDVLNKYNTICLGLTGAWNQANSPRTQPGSSTASSADDKKASSAPDSPS